MSGKPKTIVLKSDEQKKFGPEAFDLIRTKLASMVGGNVNGVKLAAEYFAPRMPATVTVADLEDAIPQMAAKFATESQNPAASKNDGRLPLNDEAQSLWDSGSWRGKLTVHGLRQRFVAEIKDDVDLTKSMIDAYVVELAAEKEKVVKLANEHDDPDSKPVVCLAPVHRGGNEPFQPKVAYLLTKVDGVLVRRKHDQGDEFILFGNFFVAVDKDGVASAVPYCDDCRGVARMMAKNAVDEYGNPEPIKNTWYTHAGAQLKLGKMKQKADGDVALLGQLRSAGARTFGGGYGTRKNKGDWRVTRGGKR